MAQNTLDWAFDLVREGEERVLRINCEGYAKIPSIENDPQTMAKTIDILTQVKDAGKIIYSQRREYEYDIEQTLNMVELSKTYEEFNRNKDKLTVAAVLEDTRFRNWVIAKQQLINQLVFFDFKQDPVGAYVKLRRLMRDERIAAKSTKNVELARHYERYLQILQYLQDVMDRTTAISAIRSELPGYELGDRDIYKKLFRPVIKPDFMYTRLQSKFPEGGELLDTYTIGDTEVNVFKLPDSVQYLYHILPPEFQLSEDYYDILDKAKRIMSEHKPTKAEFIDPERMREVFMNIGSDLIRELGQSGGISLSEKDVLLLTRILVRYTVGFGLIEVLIGDERIQDVTVNSPLGRIPLFIVHEQYGDCLTNVLPTMAESESWATKLRLISGRPLDEANPILDTELTLPGARTRVSAVAQPLNPTGLAFSFRRHRNKPWTLPLFVKYKMIDPLAAGLMSFFIDGTKTMLIAGTRSSGKSSFLGSLIVEIMRRYRVITVEDTLELPVSELRRLGYNVLQLKVTSALSEGGGTDATTGIRSTLRLGDSSLIVGEVRSKEAIALYEAMRVGAAANVVAGTIHADSPYGVYDRVVNDIGVPKTSFKATDLIIVANPIRTAGGLHKIKRIVTIAEVRKDWEEDPLREKAFVELMKYNPITDTLEPTPELINGDSEVIKSIAGSVKQWAGNWDAVWNNIQLRAKIKQTLVDTSIEEKDDDMLEAEFVIKSNDKFHTLSDQVTQEIGHADSDRIFSEWERWLKKEVKGRRFARNA